MDTNLFIIESNNDFLLVQVYVDDIVFGSANESLCEEFGNLMTNEFELSLMGELTFFLGLQIKQTPSGTFIHQGKYAKELIKKFGLESSKPMGTRQWIQIQNLKRMMMAKVWMKQGIEE